MRPVPREPRPWQFPAVTRSDVGGLTIRSCHLPGQQLASVRLVLPGGASTEPQNACGVTTLAARSLVSDALAERAEASGALIDVDVSWDATAIVVTVPADRLAGALAVVAAAVSGPPDERRIADVRARRLEELARENADPATRAARRLATDVHGQLSRYGRPLAGDDEGVGGLDVARIAEHLDRLVRLAGQTLVVAGDLNGTDVEAVAAHAFNGWTPTGRPPVARADAPKLPGGPGVVVLDRPGAVQSVVVLGASVPPRTAPDHTALALAVTCLAGNDGRLNQRLRERDGVAYHVNGGLDTHRGGGLFAVHFACATEATGGAVAAVLAELRDIANSGVGEAEVATVGASLAGRLAIDLHRPDGLAAALAQAAVLGLPDDEPSRMRAAYDGASVPDVSAAAEQYLAPARVVVVVCGEAARLVRLDELVNIPAGTT